MKKGSIDPVITVLMAATVAVSTFALVAADPIDGMMGDDIKSASGTSEIVIPEEMQDGNGAAEETQSEVTAVISEEEPAVYDHVYGEDRTVEEMRDLYFTEESVAEEEEAGATEADVTEAPEETDAAETTAAETTAEVTEATEETTQQAEETAASETDPEVTEATVIETEPEPAPEPEPVSVVYPAQGTIEYELLVLVNNARTSEGLQPLSWSGGLASAASVRLGEIQVSFSHTRPDGSECYTVNYDLVYAENLAQGQTSAAEVFNNWMNSPDHRRNIMDPEYGTMGSAYGGDNYWVQLFGY